MAMIGARGFNMGNGMPQAPSAPAFNLETPQYQLPPTAPAKPKINWMGVLADALSGAAGQPGQFAASMRQQQAEQTAFERGEQQYRTHRADSLADQRSLYDYKAAHPDDQLSQYLELARTAANPEDRAAYKAKVAAMTAPPMMSAQGFDEQGNPVMRFFPRGGASPSSPTNFPGWADEGGQSQPATGNFPYGSPLDPNLGQPPR